MVGRDLPTVTAQIIMVLLVDLLIHQAQDTHHVSPYSCFQRSMHTGFVIDGMNALFRQVADGFPEWQLQISRTSLHNIESCHVNLSDTWFLE